MSAPFDPRGLVPSDLPKLTDAEFRLVVDADLRRRVNPAGIPARVSDALRNTTNVRRWHAQLVGMSHSVEGQLVAAEDEYQADIGVIEARIAQIQGHRSNSPQIAQLRAEIAAKRAEHLRKKASRERFKTGVNEHLVMAEQILSAERDEMYESVVTAERDRLARRVRYLERAIRDHRDAIMADMDAGEVPEEYDATLWDVLDD